MDSIPASFKPDVVETADSFQWSDTTWDAHGRDVEFSLQAMKTGDPAIDARLLDGLKMSAWQAFWLAGQDKPDDLGKFPPETPAERGTRILTLKV